MVFLQNWGGYNFTPSGECISRPTKLAVVKKVDFSNGTLVGLPWRRGLCRAAAPTVQGGSARESHPGTPVWSPLKPPRGPLPAQQPGPDWVCVSASPAGDALQAPVSAPRDGAPVRPHVLHALPHGYGEGGVNAIADGNPSTRDALGTAGQTSGRQQGRSLVRTGPVTLHGLHPAHDRTVVGRVHLGFTSGSPDVPLLPHGSRGR